MPRYRSSRKHAFRPIKSSRGQSMFLRFLSEPQFEALQKFASRSSAPHVHPAAFRDISVADPISLIHALHGEEQARRRGEDVGGSLGDAFSSLGSGLYDVFIKPFWKEEKEALYAEMPELQLGRELSECLEGFGPHASNVSLPGRVRALRRPQPGSCP